MKAREIIRIDQSILLNRLIPPPANVRKAGASISIEEVAASIAAHGLLQNLQVRPATLC